MKTTKAICDDDYSEVVVTNTSQIVMFLEWLTATGWLGVILSAEELFTVYKKYLIDGAVLQQDEKTHLFCFMHELIGCVNLHWKEHALAGSRYSEVVTQSDETMGFFVLKYYSNVSPDNGQKGLGRKQKLSGKLLSNAMIWFNEQSKTLVELKLQHKTRVQELDRELNMYIMNEVKLYMHGQGTTHQMQSQTTLCTQVELDNLHDFTKLFGTQQAQV